MLLITQCIIISTPRKSLCYRNYNYLKQNNSKFHVRRFYNIRADINVNFTYKQITVGHVISVYVIISFVNEVLFILVRVTNRMSPARENTTSRVASRAGVTSPPTRTIRTTKKRPPRRTSRAVRGNRGQR